MTATWLVIVIALALVLLLLVVFVAKSRRAERKEMQADEWIALGTVFVGAGVALAVSTTPAMFAMVALGVVYMAIGLNMKRNEGEANNGGDN